MNNKINYSIDKDHGRIVAMIFGFKQELENIVKKHNAQSPYLKIDASKVIEHYPDRVRAVAKVADGDEWDEQLGKEIAKMKLLSTLFTLRDNFALDVSTLARTLAEDYLDRSEKMQELAREYETRYYDSF